MRQALSRFQAACRVTLDERARLAGIGGGKTPAAFTAACDRFTCIGVLTRAVAPKQDVDTEQESDSRELPSNEPVKESNVDDQSSNVNAISIEETVATPGFADIRGVLETAISATAREDGWSYLSRVGWYIVNKDPSFDSRNYGFQRLDHLSRAMPWAEVREDPGEGNQKSLSVGIR